MTKEKKISALDQILDEITPKERFLNLQRMRLSVNIYDLLKERNISKVEFARMMDREPSVITKWLSGTHNFTSDTLSEICFTLSIPMTKLYEEKEKPVVASWNTAVLGVQQIPSLHLGSFGRAPIGLLFPTAQSILGRTMAGYPNLSLSTHHDPVGHLAYSADDNCYHTEQTSSAFHVIGSIDFNMLQSNKKKTLVKARKNE